MATSDLQSYRILLVGKTGSGKSSTGNSVLDKNVFKSRKPYDSSDGDVIACHSSVVDGRYVFVMDGTGIGDTGRDLNGGVKSLLQSVETTMKQEMSCFNAIVLVHFIHERSQVKMKSSVFDIKSIFGRYALKHWGVLVVTFGDLFDVNDLDENIHSFEDWCQQQTGYFQILLEECGNRCVLFDNKTTDKNKQMEQRKKIMSVVDKMTYKPYSLDDFDSPTCKISRQQLILMEEVNSKFEKFNGNMNSQNDVSEQELELLMTKLMDHKQLLTGQGQELEFSLQLLNQIRETVQKLDLKTRKMFQDFQQTMLEQFEHSYPVFLKSEEPTVSQLKFPFLNPVDELRNTTLATPVLEITDEKIMMKIEARGRRESAIQNKTTKEKCTLLLVGRAGSGKSSIGNSILGQSEFAPRSPSEVKKLKNEIAHNDEFVVVDCSGIGDSAPDMPGGMSSIMLSAFDALIINNNIQDGMNPVKSDKQHILLKQRCGFNVLIFVLKYGAQFTKQEKDAVQMIKSIFGQNVFRDWGILVFSHGDNFKTDMKENDTSFDEWCKEQRGEIKTLFEEVRYRCVLFDNKTRDKDKLEKQRCKLNEIILTLDKREDVGVTLQNYLLEDYIIVRTKQIEERYTTLDDKTEHLLTMTLKEDKGRNNKATLHLQTKLKSEWLNLRREIDEQKEYFSWEEKTVVNIKEYTSTQVKAKYEETTPVMTEDEETNPIMTEDEGKKTVKFKYKETNPVKTKYEETKPVKTKYEETKPVKTKYVEPKPFKTKDDEPAPLTTKEDGSTPFKAKEDENEKHKPKQFKEEDHSKINNLHFVKFKRSHQCQFNFRHEHIIKAYTAYLKFKQPGIKYTIEKLIEIETRSCILS